MLFCEVENLLQTFFTFVYSYYSFTWYPISYTQIQHNNQPEDIILILLYFLVKVSLKVLYIYISKGFITITGEEKNNGIMNNVVSIISVEVILHLINYHND